MLRTFSNGSSASAERSNYYLLWSRRLHGLFCAPIPGQILSTNVPTLSEQNRKNSAAQQASAFCHYGSDSIMAGQRFHRSALKRGKEAFLAASSLMELKAKGVFAQRRDYQPFNVERSGSSSLMSASTLPYRGFSRQPEKHGGRTRPVKSRCSSSGPFVFFGLSRSGKIQHAQIYPVFFSRTGLNF